MPLLAVEGIEASGKTTFCKALIDYFDNEGCKTYYTADPAHESVSAHIRELICKNKYRQLTTLMLINAARSNNYYETVKPKLDDDVIVITDRFVLTSYVYHSEACGQYTVRDLHGIGTENVLPWKTFIVDVPAEIAAERIAERNDTTDVFDNVPIDTLNRWRWGFLDANKKYKEASENDYVVIDGSISVEDMIETAKPHIKALLNTDWYKKEVA